jgi:hypothetical protein
MRQVPRMEGDGAGENKGKVVSLRALWLDGIHSFRLGPVPETEPL